METENQLRLSNHSSYCATMYSTYQCCPSKRNSDKIHILFIKHSYEMSRKRNAITINKSDKFYVFLKNNFLIHLSIFSILFSSKHFHICFINVTHSSFAIYRISIITYRCSQYAMIIKFHHLIVSKIGKLLYGHWILLSE